MEQVHLCCRTSKKLGNRQYPFLLEVGEKMVDPKKNKIIGQKSVLLPNRFANICPHENLYANVYSCFIPNHSKLEASKMSLNR